MIVNPDQIRAARGLLDWTVAQLAQKVGVGTTTISAIETGRSAGSLEVMSAIIYAFQSAGIELTEDGGVRPCQSEISIYRNHIGFCAFFDDVYDVVKNNDDADVSVINANESEFDRWLGSYEPIHVQRMIELNKPKLRVLMKEQDVHLTSTAYCQYRWVPAEQFANVIIYIYGSKTAFIEFNERDVVVTVVDNKAVTNTLRKLFETTWLNASLSPEL